MSTLTITVTADDIRRCGGVIVRAMERVGITEAWASPYGMAGIYKGNWFAAAPPAEVMDYIERKLTERAVAPFEFELPVRN